MSLISLKPGEKTLQPGANRAVQLKIRFDM